MENSPLETILNPHGIVIFGANNTFSTMGTGQMADILHGYPGKVFPIHPKLDTVLGLQAYKSVLDIPPEEEIDLAFIVIPAKYVPQALDECGQRGIKHAVIVTAGFRETGNDDLNDQLISVARNYGIRFVGPNCFGFYNHNISWAQSETGAVINTTWIPLEMRNGGVSIASQSGTYASHIFITAQNMGMGVNKTISVGNEASIDLVDCLEYFEQDPSTRVIGLYIEEVHRGREFMAAASRIVKTKPIVAMYVGGTEAGGRAGKSHTGSLGGNDKIFDAMTRQVGIIRAMTLEELLDYCYILDVAPLPKGDKICVFTNAGGPGATMCDLADRLGLKVPVFTREFQNKLRDLIKVPTAQVHNMVDLTFDIDSEKFFRTLPRTILKSDEIDGMLVYGILGWSLYQVIQDIAPALNIPVDDIRSIQLPLLEHYIKLPATFGKPVIAVSFFGRSDSAVSYLLDHGFPVFETTHRAVKAFWALNEYRKIRERIESREKMED
jgi:acetyltransferase